MKYWILMIAVACLMLPATARSARADDIDHQVIGPWKLEMTVPTGEKKEPIVLVGHQYGKYAAWYAGKNGLEPFQDVQLKGDALVGTIKPKEEPGVKLTITARAKDKDGCAGTVRYESQDGDSGQWEFTGRRIDMASLDEVTKWKLQFVTPDYEEHAPTITVISEGDNHYAWFSGKDREIPVVKITIDGDRVEMTVVTKTPDGQAVEVRFRGTFDDTRVQGKAEYRLGEETGSFQFTGKRVS